MGRLGWSGVIESLLSRSMDGARPELSSLGAPLPGRLASVTMNAGPDCRRLALLIDIVAAVPNEGPGMTIGHHVGPEVAAIHAAKRDRATRDYGQTFSPSRLGCNSRMAHDQWLRT
jgi:hypothetical protein